MHLIRTAMFILLLGCAGCVRLGTRIEHIPLPPGAPDVREVLAGLVQNETDLQTFRATGTVMIKAPEIESTQVSRESVLHYRYPDHLYVIGRRYGTRIIELVYADDAFLIELPTRREYCFQTTEEAFETITTADIVREMFIPEDWATLSDRNVRITSYSEDTQTAVLEIWDLDRAPWLRRMLRVRGAPWVVLESKRLTPEGQMIAHTIKSNYHEQEHIRYPTEIEVSFPGENAWMRFIMRRVDVNISLDDANFELVERAALLEGRGFNQVDLFSGEGPTLDDIIE